MNRGWSRAATAIVFTADGAAFGLWVSHLSVLRERFVLDPATLAAVLFVVSLGAIVGTFVGTRIMLVSGDTRMLQGGVIVTALLIVATLSAPTLPALFAIAFAFAIALGSTEVAMNAVASRVQIAAGRAWMSSFHGFWSMGFFGGASMTTLLLAAHGPDVVGPGFVLALMALTGAWWTQRIPVDATARVAGSSPPLDRATSKAIVQLAAIVFFGWLGEGALTDWGPIFISVVHGQTAAVAAGVSTAYGLAMTAARFGGDSLVERFGARGILIASTASAAFTVGIATIAPSVAITIVAFAFGGAAIANLSPLVFSLGGRYGGRAVGMLTSIGYVAFLSGPAMLGGAAHFVGLRAAFAIPIAALGVSALLATRLKRD